MAPQTPWPKGVCVCEEGSCDLLNKTAPGLREEALRRGALPQWLECSGHSREYAGFNPSPSIVLQVQYLSGLLGL